MDETGKGFEYYDLKRKKFEAEMEILNKRKKYYEDLLGILGKDPDEPTYVPKPEQSQEDEKGEYPIPSLGGLQGTSSVILAYYESQMAGYLMPKLTPEPAPKSVRKPRRQKAK